jgi:MFS family permease
VFNVGSLLGYVSAGFIAEAIGRKRYMSWTFLGAMLTTPLVFYFCTSLPAIVVGSAVLGFFTLGSFSWLPIYLPELFGTRIRATATGLVFNIGRLVAFGIPVWVSALASSSGGPLTPACWLAALFLISLGALRFLPETVGKGLPE